MMTANTTYFYSIENYKKSKTKAKNQKKLTLLLTTIQLSEVKQL